MSLLARKSIENCKEYFSFLSPSNNEATFGNYIPGLLCILIPNTLAKAVKLTKVTKIPIEKTEAKAYVGVDASNYLE